MMASHVLDNEKLQMKAEEDMVAAQAVHAAAVLARRDALAAIGEDALLRRKQLAAEEAWNAAVEEARNAAVEEDDRARKVAAFSSLQRKKLAAEEARNTAVEEDDRARKVAAKEDFNRGLMVGHALGSQRYGR